MMWPADFLHLYIFLSDLILFVEGVNERLCGQVLVMMRTINAVAGLGLDDCDCLLLRFQAKIYSITQSTLGLFKLLLL